MRTIVFSLRLVILSDQFDWLFSTICTHILWMEGGRDCVKDRFSWPNGNSMNRENEDQDSSVTCRLGKFMNRHDLAEMSYCSPQLIISAMEVRMYNERQKKWLSLNGFNFYQKRLEKQKIKRIISLIVLQIEKMIINGNGKYISDQTGDTSRTCWEKAIRK